MSQIGLELIVYLHESKYMIFGTHQMINKYKNIKVQYENITLELVTKYKYLGIMLDPTLSFSEHVKYIVSKARSTS